MVSTTFQTIRNSFLNAVMILAVAGSLSINIFTQEPKIANAPETPTKLSRIDPFNDEIAPKPTPGLGRFLRTSIAKRSEQALKAAGLSVPDPSFVPEIVSYPGAIRTSAIQADGKLLIGGIFEFLNGSRIGGLARLNPDYSLDTSFSPKVDAGVNAVIIQPDGKIIIGGMFTHVNGVPINRVARLNTDGSLDTSFDPRGGFDNAVYSLSFQNDKILVGGFYTRFDGTVQPPLVRLNSDGTLDSSYHVELYDSYGYVLSMIALPNGEVLAAGIFYSDAIQDYLYLAKFNSNGALDFSFDYSGPDSVVREIAPDSGGKYVIGGSFTSYNNIPRNRVARINPNGTLDDTFSPGSGADGSVSSVSVLDSGKILVGGAFTNFNGSESKYLAQLLADGSLDESFSVGTGFNSFVYETQQLPSSRIFVGGAFTSYQEIPGDIGVIIEPDGAPKDLSGLTSLARATLRVVLDQPDGKVLLGGSFNRVNGSDYNNFVRLNADGSIDPEFSIGTGPNGLVYAAALQPDGKILIGGQFTTINGTAKSRLARLNADGTVDTTFVAETNSSVACIVVLADGRIMIGGQFTTVNGVSHQGIARLNADGTLDNSFAPQTSFSFVEGIAVQPNGRILVGGLFTEPKFAFRSLVRLQANGTLDLSFLATLAEGTGIYSLVLQPDGKILIGGTFSEVDFVVQGGVARLNSDGSRDTTFNVGTGTGNGDDVEDIVLQPDGKILLGGSISVLDGAPVENVVRLNSDGTRDTSFNVTTDSTIWDLELVNSDPEKLYAAGDFTSTNGHTRLGTARYDLSEQAAVTSPFDFDGDGRTDISVFRPSTGNWWVNGSSSTVNVVAFGSATDMIVPADYTGDGKADQAVWRPETGEWFVLRSDGTGYYGFTFGADGDIPVPADYDGDGKADAAVFRASDSTWYIFMSSGGVQTVTFGSVGDIPAPADYDGDGKTDIAVVRSSGGVYQWWIRSSSDLKTAVMQFGADGDKPVAGDYTGDGRADIAVWRPSTGEWFVLQSENAQYYSFAFGLDGDMPVLGDYDGDGKLDAAVFRPTDSNWYVNGSASGIYIQRYGASDDRPIPNAFVR